MGTKKSIVKATLIISLGALFVKIFSFINNLIIAYYFGQGPETDSFFASIIIPTIIVSILIGAFENSIIPVFSKIDTENERNDFVNQLVTIFSIALLFITILLIFVSPTILKITTYGFDANRTKLVVSLAKISFWSILFQGLSGVIISLLNANKRFTITSITGSAIPILMIIWMVLKKDLGIFSVPQGLIMGAFVQSVILVFILFKNIKPKLDLKWNPHFTKILHNFKYLIAGMLLIQLNPLIDQVMVSGQPAGSLSALQYAWKIMDIPIVMMIMAGSRALLPYLSEFSKENSVELKKNLGFQIWVIGIPVLITSIIIYLFPQIIIRLMFQRGQFGLDSTLNSSYALKAYAVGLLPMAMGTLIPRAYNALQKNHILMYLTIFSVSANIFFNLIFVELFGFVGIAISTSMVVTLTSIILGLLLIKEIGVEWLYPPEQIIEIFQRFFSIKRKRDSTNTSICMLIFNMHPAPLGGTERQAILLAKNLIKRGHEVFFLTPKRDKSWAKRNIHKNIDVVRYSTFRLFGKYRMGRFFYWFAALSMAYNLFKLRNAYDIIHIYILSNHSIVGTIMGWLLRKPVIIKIAASGKFSDFDYLKDQAFGNLTEKIVKKMQPIIISTSNKAYELMNKEGFSHIELIPNGIELTSWRDAHHSFRKGDTLKIVSVGRLVNDKDYDTLLKGYRIIKNKGINFQAKIVGDGSLHQQLSDLIIQYDLLGHVVLSGHSENVNQILSESDLYIISSVSEGMPNALLEAMATGLPCIATNISGCEDIITNGQNGILVEPENEIELAKYIESIYNNYDLAIKMGVNARKTIIDKYSINHVTNSYEKLYEKLCASNGKQYSIDELSANSPVAPAVSLTDREK